MIPPIPYLITIYGLLLTVAAGAVLLLLWNSTQRSVYVFYTVFLLSLSLWVFTSLFLRTLPVADNNTEDVMEWGMRWFEICFVACSLSVFLLAAHLSDLSRQAGRIGLWLGVGSVGVVHVVYTFLATASPLDDQGDGRIDYSLSDVTVLIVVGFALAMLAILFQNRRKFNYPLVQWGLFAFGVGQIATILSPDFRTYSAAEGVSAVAALTVGYALVQQNIMLPLRGRTQEQEAVRVVGLAMTGDLVVDEVLPAIAHQAATLTEADGSAIYLRQNDQLVLQAVYNIPQMPTGLAQPLGHGFVGYVAQKNETILLRDYNAEWHGDPDIPMADESFGSVIGVPLHFQDMVVGVLLVFAGRSGRRFETQDMKLMDLIGPQAAVSIINSRLFAQERALRDKLQNANQQLEAVLNNTENPVLVLNRKLEVLFSNPAANHLLDKLTPEPVDWHSTTLVQHIDADLLPKPRRLIRDILRKQAHVYEMSFDDRDYLCHVTRTDKPIRGWVAVLNDITQLKHVDRLKSHMVRMTTHDLKNPLFAVMTYLELLEDDGEGVFDDEMRYYMAAIWKQMTRMQRIITGILDLEKIQSGAPPMALCDMKGIATRAVADIEHKAGNKGIEIETRFDAQAFEVLGDAPQLHQAIANLLDNAIKYTSDGGKIWLRAYNQGQTLIIEVEDTGIGIPREVQNQVFDRFFRVESSYNRTANGSGLGLSLVKSIVDHHKGRIWLRSDDGGGSTFYVALPVATSPENV